MAPWSALAFAAVAVLATTAAGGKTARAARPVRPGAKKGALAQGWAQQKQETDLFIGTASLVHEVRAGWLEARCGLLAEDDEAVLVNFYSGSCGHCQRFAETWNSVAAAAASDRFKGRVSVVALNCDVERDICTTYSVNSTPKIVGFGAGTDPCKPETGALLGEAFEDILAWVQQTLVSASPRPPPMPSAADATAASDNTDPADAALSAVSADAPPDEDADGSATKSAAAASLALEDLEADRVEDESAPASEGGVESASETPGTTGIVTSPALVQPSSADGEANAGRPVLALDGTDGTDGTEDASSDEPEDEETVARASAKELMKRDLANAVRFGLETGVFLGRHELVGDELHALFAWINVLRQSFPGSRERAQLDKLLSQLKALESRERGRISAAAFDSILRTWAFARFDRAEANRLAHVVDSSTEAGKWRATWTLCRAKRLKDIGVYGGYPCALWMLLHSLTVASGAGGASPELTLSAMHGFVAHFFSCNECRENFVESNPNPQRDVLNKAAAMGISPSRALVIWLWAEHNAVSRRLNSENVKAAEQSKRRGKARLARSRMVFPLVDQCRKCRLSDSANTEPSTSSGGRTALRSAGPGQSAQRVRQRDLEYLSNQVSQGPNAAFRDVLLGPGASVGVAATSQEEDWDFDVLHSFLVHTYCFNDGKLRCPEVRSEAPGPFAAFRLVAGLSAGVALVALAIFFKPLSHVVQAVRRAMKSPKQRH